MKKNILLAATLALIAALTFSVNNLRAQNSPPPGGPPPGQQPPPNFRQGGPAGMRGRPGPAMIYRQASMVLKRAKTELERGTNDYDGHRQSAIEACDKALQEMDAVQKVIADEAKARAAAAAAAAQQTNSTPAPAGQ